MKKHTHYKQLDYMDCGATCLQIVAKSHKKDYNISYLRKLCETSRFGVSLESISYAAEEINFNTLGITTNAKELINAPLPCILHWRNKHFVVLHQIKQSNKKELNFLISDPAAESLIKVDYDTFTDLWHGKETNEGIALPLEPTPNFYKSEDDIEEEKKNKKVTRSKLAGYLFQHKGYFSLILLGLGAASLLQLLIPFLTQGIVDRGVNKQNISFVYIALVALFILMLGRTIIEFSRQGLLLFISTKINLSLLTNFG